MINATTKAYGRILAEAQVDKVKTGRLRRVAVLVCTFLWLPIEMATVPSVF